jgi:hypothetical protein
MTGHTRVALAALVGCALFGAACDRSSPTSARPSPGMSPAAVPGPPPAASLQFAVAARWSAP